MANEIPVYLFVGFLESGKTKFIQETFEDPNFDSGDKTLLLVCEEGEEEYNEKKFAFPGVTLYNLEDKAELNPQNLAKLAREADAGRVVIEYNGMWMLQDLANNLPENWIVYQCIATADGTTALTYARDNSMRALMLDKIARSELIVFNRAEAVNNDAARHRFFKHPDFIKGFRFSTYDKRTKEANTCIVGTVLLSDAKEFIFQTFHFSVVNLTLALTQLMRHGSKNFI